MSDPEMPRPVLPWAGMGTVPPERYDPSHPDHPDHDLVRRAAAIIDEKHEFNIFTDEYEGAEDAAEAVIALVRAHDAPPETIV